VGVHVPATYFVTAQSGADLALTPTGSDQRKKLPEAEIQKIFSCQILICTLVVFAT
jgi:hypothetical protein